MLRHFLHRCTSNGGLSDAEVDLLIQIKLPGNSGDDVAELNAEAARSNSRPMQEPFPLLIRQDAIHLKPRSEEWNRRLK